MVDIDNLAHDDHPEMQTAPSAHVDVQAASDQERILMVLDSISDTLRIPLMLRDGDGQSYEEIAAHLGIGLSAVKMRIKRAREEFRAAFANTSVASVTKDQAS